MARFSVRLAAARTCWGSTFAVAVMLGTGCAARSSRPGGLHADGPARAADAVLAQAHAAWDAGRVAEALGLFARTADVSVPVPQRREALVAQGLLLLDPTSAHHNLDGARSLLTAAMALYDATPLHVATAKATADALVALRLDAAASGRQQAAAVERHATLTRQLKIARDEQASLMRIVGQLRSELEQRDAALRKAADGVMGGSRPRPPSPGSRTPEGH